MGQQLYDQADDAVVRSISQSNCYATNCGAKTHFLVRLKAIQPEEQMLQSFQQLLILFKKGPQLAIIIVYQRGDGMQ